MALLLWATATGGLAQEEAMRPWQQYLDDLSETEDFEGQSWEAYEDVLAEYAEHPININTATREDLQHLPFLSAQQMTDGAARRSGM